MSTLSITKTYADGVVLFEADLDAICDSIEAFINVTKISDDNIQNGGITGSTKLVDASIPAAKLATDAVTTTKIQDDAVTTAKIDDEAVTAAKLAAAVSAALLPTGVVLAYTSTVAPTGFLLCDGTAVSRTTYSALFAVMGTAHGNGDGSTTFHLPDYRGRFLRGLDGAASRDPDASGRTAMNSGGNTGNNVGSVQDDAFEEHDHGGLVDDNFNAFTNNRLSTGGQAGTSLTAGTVDNINTHNHSIFPDGDSTETRPKNAYVAYIVKT